MSRKGGSKCIICHQFCPTWQRVTVEHGSVHKGTCYTEYKAETERKPGEPIDERKRQESA